MSDLIKREDAIKALCDSCGWKESQCDQDSGFWCESGGLIRRDIPSADRPQEWIPCSERLPKDLEVVNITWVNHRPMTYYADIKDEPFTATAIHYKDKWWWYSPICEDLLEEYGKSECDKMDADIEVTAWMPLPKPWKGASNGEDIQSADE